MITLTATLFLSILKFKTFNFIQQWLHTYFKHLKFILIYPALFSKGIITLSIYFKINFYTCTFWTCLYVHIRVHTLVHVVYLPHHISRFLKKDHSCIFVKIKISNITLMIIQFYSCVKTRDRLYSNTVITLSSSVPYNESLKNQKTGKNLILYPKVFTRNIMNEIVYSPSTNLFVLIMKITFIINTRQRFGWFCLPGLLLGWLGLLCMPWTVNKYRLGTSFSWPLESDSPDQ